MSSLASGKEVHHALTAGKEYSTLSVTEAMVGGY